MADSIHDDKYKRVPKFEVGDIVRLIAGGTKMTVESLPADEAYFRDGERITGIFAIPMLGPLPENMSKIRYYTGMVDVVWFDKGDQLHRDQFPEETLAALG